MVATFAPACIKDGDSATLRAVPLSLQVESHLLTVEARETAILEHLGLAKSIARRFHRRLHPKVDMQELISEANLGLTQAAASYQTNRDAAFKSWASRKIHGTIRDYLRSIDIAPRDERKIINNLLKSVHTAADPVCADIMRSTTTSEIESFMSKFFRDQIMASSAHMETKAFLLAMMGLYIKTSCITASGTPVSIEALLAGKKEGSEATSAPLPSIQETPEQVAIEKDLKEKLRSAIEALQDPQQHTVMRGIYELGTPKQKIADQLGVTPPRVTHIHTDAVEVLREALRPTANKKVMAKAGCG